MVLVKIEIIFALLNPIRIKKKKSSSLGVPLTKIYRAWGPYSGRLARCCGDTDLAVFGPRENNRGKIFPSSPINHFIIWQGSPEVNSSVLINHFHGNGHKPVISQQIQNKQVWSECHMINYLITLLPWAILRDIGPRSLFFLLALAARSPHCHDLELIFLIAALKPG